MSRFPFPIPNGWFAMCFSDELVAGQIKRLRYVARELVAMRGDDGVARVFDAHCAHLGAHIGHGGKVEGDGVRCPFHGWRFDGSGACVEVPYAKRDFAFPEERIRPAQPRGLRCADVVAEQLHDLRFVGRHHEEALEKEDPDRHDRDAGHHERTREHLVLSAVGSLAGCERGGNEQGQEHQWEQRKSRNPVTETFAHHRNLQ